MRPEAQGDHARRVGLQGQVDEVEPLPLAVEHLQVADVVVGRAAWPSLSAWASLTQAWSCCRRCSASRIEVSSRSSRWRSAGPSVFGERPAPGRARRRGCSGRSGCARTSRATSSGVPSMNSCLKTCGGPLLGRHLHALAVPRQVAAAQRQGGEPRLAAEARRDFLVERDGVADVAEADALGRHAGEQGDLGVVSAGVAAVRHAGEHREVARGGPAAASGSASARSPCRPSRGRSTARAARAAGR